MTSPVNPWPGTSAPGPNARQFLRALWIAVSAYPLASIEVDNTVEVYGETYTVAAVGTGSFGQVVLTDTNGAGWYVPNYACPLSDQVSTGEVIVTNYNAAENTGS